VTAKTPTPAPEPGDTALINAAVQANTSATRLADAASMPLYDPHTLWRVLEQMTGAVAAMKTAAGLIERKIGKADEAGLLISEQPDLADAGEAAYEARDLLRGAVQAAEQFRHALSRAADETAVFAPRPAAPETGEQP
jgi:hypothetical protein